ncbi:MAG TPA: AMP-binding protein, partial [Streptosporangiaceae bacterium]|nr:AMP-binding protein [Streptosporangiaceae bacterium]
MTNTDKPHIAPTPEAAQTPKETTYVVAVNDQGQHAVWSAELALPVGWRQQSAVMPKRACLAAIAATWQDIAPVSVRGVGREPERRDASPRGAEDRYEMSHEHNVRYVHDLFGEQASRRPHSAAVVSAGTQLTYRQLDESANQLAHHLQEMGVGPETLVGVCLERGIDAIRCLLAILKAAGAYLPLDPSLPAARLTQMCTEARPTVVLVRGADARAFSETDAQLLLIDEWAPKLASQPTTVPSVRPQAENMAYAIYTSGSTGRPKAVAVSHGSLACVSQEISREYQISPDDRVLQLASLGFDTSVEQILVTLICGATLMLPAAGTVAPTDLLRYLSEEQVSVIDLTPAYWHQVVAITEPDDERLRSVRLMITGGERADPADCGAAIRAAPRARLLNAYGLTETTITSTLFDAGEELAAQEPP